MENTPSSLSESLLVEGLSDSDPEEMSLSLSIFFCWLLFLEIIQQYQRNHILQWWKSWKIDQNFFTRFLPACNSRIPDLLTSQQPSSESSWNNWDFFHKNLQKQESILIPVNLWILSVISDHHLWHYSHPNKNDKVGRCLKISMIWLNKLRVKGYLKSVELTLIFGCIPNFFNKRSFWIVNIKQIHLGAVLNGENLQFF